MNKFLVLFFALLFSIMQVNANDDDFYTYLKQVRNNADKAWNCPKYQTLYSTDVDFKILKGGRIVDVKLKKSSGSKTVDNLALNTIKSLPVQDPLPAVYDAPFIDVTMTLYSNHVSGLHSKSKKSKNYSKEKIIECKKVKIKKVIYDANFKGVSNFEDNMIKPVLNLNIQNALKNNN